MRYMRQWVLGYFVLAASVLWAQDISIKPGKMGAVDAARDLLVRTLGKGDVQDADLGDTMLCDPLLEKTLAAQLPPYDGPLVLFMVDATFPYGKWDLPTADLSGLDPAKRAEIEKAAREQKRIPVTARRFVGGERMEFWRRLADWVGPFGPEDVRPASVEDAAYYWSLIPYELKEPVLVAKGARNTVVVDFDDQGKPFFVSVHPDGARMPGAPEGWQRHLEGATAAGTLKCPWVIHVPAMGSQPPSEQKGSAKVELRLLPEACDGGLRLKGITTDVLIKMEQNGAAAVMALSVKVTAEVAWSDDQARVQIPDLVVMVKAESGETPVRLRSGRLLGVKGAGVKTVQVEYVGSEELTLPQFWSWAALLCAR